MVLDTLAILPVETHSLSALIHVKLFLILITQERNTLLYKKNKTE